MSLLANRVPPIEDSGVVAGLTAADVDLPKVPPIVIVGLGED